MAIALDDVWNQREVEAAAIAANHHLAILTYAAAHNVMPLSIGHSEFNAILEKCPDTGPASNNPIETTWQQDDRWSRCTLLNRGGVNEVQSYNGLDFLIAHNLMQIVFCTR